MHFRSKLAGVVKVNRAAAINGWPLYSGSDSEDLVKETLEKQFELVKMRTGQNGVPGRLETLLLSPHSLI